MKHTFELFYHLKDTGKLNLTPFIECRVGPSWFTHPMICPNLKIQEENDVIWLISLALVLGATGWRWLGGRSSCSQCCLSSIWFCTIYPGPHLSDNDEVPTEDHFIDTQEDNNFDRAFIVLLLLTLALSLPHLLLVGGVLIIKISKCLWRLVLIEWLQVCGAKWSGSGVES